MELCKLIYAKRKDKGLSQEKLAEEIGVARQTISKWETGETLPDAESLKRLAEALDFSVDDALGLETGGDGGDDRLEWLIIGGFVIGNSLSLVFDNFILGLAGGMMGLGAGFVWRAVRKRRD